MVKVASIRRKRLRVGGTLDPLEDIYIERAQDGELYRLLRQGEYCNVLTSRQMGKSSAMRYASMRLAGDNIQFAEIDFAGNLGSTDLSLDQWYCGFLIHISRELAVSFDIDAWWDQHSRRTPSQRLQMFFREVLIPLIDTSVVVFVDEIDAALKLPFTDDFFTAIRAMYNQRSQVPEYKRVTFCLLGVAHPNEFIRDRRTTPYNIGTSIELSDFRLDRDDLSLLEGLLDRKQRCAGRALLEEILSWTAGHPFLTASLCQKCIEEENCQSPSDLRQMIESSFRDVRAARRDTHFLSIIRRIDVRDSLDELSYYERICKGDKVSDDIDKAKINLKLSGLVKRDNQGNLVVRNRIYEQVFDLNWVHATRPKKAVRRLWLAAIISTLLLGVGGSWLWYFLSVVQPQKDLREQILTQSRTTLEQTSDDNKARLHYEILAGIRIHPDLDKRLVGHEQEADRLYRAFWDRGADLLHKHANKAFDANQTDAALLTAALASVKADRRLPEQVQRAYEARRYDHLVTTLRGHTGAVNGAVFTSDSSSLVTVSDDGTIRMWDARTGKELDRTSYQPGRQSPRITSISMIQRRGENGEDIVVTVAETNHIRVWKLIPQPSDGYSLQWESEFRIPEKYHGVVNHASLHPERALLLTVGDYVRLWDISSGQLGKVLGSAGQDAWFASFDNRGQRFAVASNNGDAEVWHTDLRRRPLPLLHHPEMVTMAMFDATGQGVLTASHDAHARLWTPRAGVFNPEVEFFHDVPQLPYRTQYVTSVSSCEDSQWIATSARREAREPVEDAEFDATSYTVIWRRDGALHRAFPSASAVYDAALSPDCKLVASSREDGLVQIWSVSDSRSQDREYTAQERWIAWQNKLQLTVNEAGEVEPLGGKQPGEAMGKREALDAKQ